MFDIGSAAYDACMTPLEMGALSQVRASLLPQASGRIIEVGAGTGVNLAYYDFSKIDELILSDRRVRPRLFDSAAAEQRRHVTVLEADAEALPFATGIFDTVVATLVFCSVPDPERGLAELARVLKPGGALIFIEHVIAHHPVARWAMNVTNPAWRLFAGGCNINRDTAPVIERAGFFFARLERFGHGLGIAGIARKDGVSASAGPLRFGTARQRDSPPRRPGS